MSHSSQLYIQQLQLLRKDLFRLMNQLPPNSVIRAKPVADCALRLCSAEINHLNDPNGKCYENDPLELRNQISYIITLLNVDSDKALWQSYDDMLDSLINRG